jgi:hypothetical protein
VQFVFALAALITDESVRLRVLEAIFPKMHVTLLPTKSINNEFKMRHNPGLRGGDPMKTERVYRVTGEPTSQDDWCASEDLATNRWSKTREVRVLVFGWPGLPGRELAVAQYLYVGANPAGACWSIGRLYGVEGTTVATEFTLETIHHSAIHEIQWVDLSGDGVEELIVESNSGGAGTFGVGFWAFDLKGGNFMRRFKTTSLLSETIEGNEFTQTLNIDRTRETGGTKFCFTKTTYVEKAVRFRKPRVTHPCYKAN